MNLTEAQGLSQIYVNGELVSKKEFKSENDGETINYVLKNNDDVISGEISAEKLDEDDLIKLLQVSNSKKDLIKTLEDDWPLDDKSKDKDKSKKTKRRKKSSKKRSKKRKASK
tara:strand:+ start:286 stop:624 length:339 start_codon:yes stop_codon:yes gene_type:complete